MHLLMWYTSAMLLYCSYFATPVYSGSHEFIPYKVIQKTENWEQRMYDFGDRYLFGIHKTKVKDFETERKDANKKLIDFIHGKNKEHVNILFALPAVEIMAPEGFYSIFYTPRSTKSVPQPLDGEIKSGHSVGIVVGYVKTLHGSPTYSEIKLAALLFVKALKKEGISLDINTLVIIRYSENVDAKLVEIMMGVK